MYPIREVLRCSVRGTRAYAGVCGFYTASVGNRCHGGSLSAHAGFFSALLSYVCIVRRDPLLADRLHRHSVPGDATGAVGYLR